IETSQPRKFFERVSRKGVGVWCGTVGVRSFGALVLGAQRAYRRRLVDRFSRSSRVETMLRGSALCSMAFLSLPLSLSLHTHTYARMHAYTRIRCKMTRGEVLHRIVMFKKCHRMTREIYAMPDAILRERQSGMPGSTCVSVRAGSTCDTSPFFLLGRPSFLHRLMDFNESRGMSATNEGKVVGRQTRAAAAVKLENSRDP
ncbi:hypothetical protein ALC62_05891, partial [Cyphomyrmex costatus]